jgi:FkbM family methyltransferase
MHFNFIYRLNQKWKYHTADTPLQKMTAEINRNQQLVILYPSTFKIHGCELVFNRKHHSFIIERFPLFQVLLNGGKFVIEGSDLLYIVNGITLTVTTAEEIFIIYEVFFQGSYNYLFDRPSIVIDIGMNVGFASLFFAARKEVLKVFGFEPFLPTFQNASNNLKLNPALSKKINAFQFGLSNKDGIIHALYNYDNKGQVGIYGTSLIKSEIEATENLQIELKSAYFQIDNIITEHPGKGIIIKIDCEGSEYAILQDLFDNGLLIKIDIIFIEWHERGPDDLLSYLKDSGFKAFYNQQKNKSTGMIYAVR